jgi:hypothetical protein
MNKIETKFILCLADPELTDSDFKQLVEMLDRREFKELISAADHLRRVSRDYLKDAPRARVPHDFVKHVQQLLLEEGEMSPTKAVRSLLTELRDEPIPARKWTIRAGLEYALKFASESDIVAAAQRVLAKHSLSPQNHAWSLKKPS